MGDQVSKKDLETILERKLDKYQQSLISVFDAEFRKAEKERAELRRAIRELTTTLDAFLKRMTDIEQEFLILKREMDHVNRLRRFLAPRLESAKACFCTLLALRRQ